MVYIQDVVHMIPSPSMLSHQTLTYTNTTPNGNSNNNNSGNINNINTNNNNIIINNNSNGYRHYHNIHSNNRQPTNSPFASTPTRSKRRFSNSDPDLKKSKQQPIINHNNHNHNYNHSHNKSNLELTLENINLNEYPKFHHPDGGYIQFTPIGNIRTFLSDNNIVQSIIEKKSSFDLNNLQNGIDGYKLYLGRPTTTTTSSSSQNNNNNQLNSPSSEAENYMRNGYNNIMTPNSSFDNSTNANGNGNGNGSAIYYGEDSCANRLNYYFNDDDDEFDEDDYDMN
ncbi:hypothetical protein B5S31_g5697 [[Candida] boidinii]|nr:hypothetical protein B5S31_g5697 [[Candida] boidinii]